MSPNAVLKAIKKEYPALNELPKPQLKLVEKAILHASKLAAEDFLSRDEHNELMKKLDVPEPSPARSLRAYRYRENLTQKQLSQKSGITQANISSMEQGKRPIGLKVAKKLAEILNCRYQKFIED